MSRILGVSRSAVWKAVKQLEAQGYRIESKTKKGYRLVQTPDLLLEEELKDLLHTKVLASVILHTDATSSTSDTAFQMAEDSQKDGIVVISEFQSQGRGRKHSNWLCVQGKGIYCSVVLRPKISFSQLPQMAVMASLAVCQAIQTIIQKPVQCRYPGDVLVEGKKICGILTEFKGELEQISYVVLGIGIHVNLGQKALYPDQSTPLEIITGEKQNRKQLLAELLNQLDRCYCRYQERKFPEIEKEYRTFDPQYNK